MFISKTSTGNAMWMWMEGTWPSVSMDQSEWTLGWDLDVTKFKSVGSRTDLRSAWPARATWHLKYPIHALSVFEFEHSPSLYRHRCHRPESWTNTKSSRPGPTRSALTLTPPTERLPWSTRTGSPLWAWPIRNKLFWSTSRWTNHARNLFSTVS